MGRPRKFDPEVTVQQIMETFWAKGYEATSISDLMAATGLKKGSLYASFGDKSDMFLLALEAYDRAGVRAAADMMDGLPGVEALAALLRVPASAVDMGDRKGCLLCNSLSEFEALDARAQAHVTRSRQIMLDAIERALVRAGHDAGIRAQAVQLLAVYLGQRVMARGGVDAGTLVAIGRQSLAKP